MGSSAIAQPGHARKSKGWRSSYTVLLIWILMGIYLWTQQRYVLLALPLAATSNVFQMLWNLFFACLLTHAVIRVWLIPLWRIIFQETGKLGQKLEWYDSNFRHLSPDGRTVLINRFIIVFCLSLLFFLIAFFEFMPVSEYLPQFADLLSSDLASRTLKSFFSQSPWPTLHGFSMFSFLLWINLSFEGRSRIILRAIKKLKKYKDSRYFLEPLPTIPYDRNASELNVTLFSAFCNDEGRFSLKQTTKEKWFKISEKGLRGNALVIGPTGGGKTRAVVLPLLEQAMCWQSDSPDKKAAMVVYDPKAELTSIVKESAADSGRSKDLVVFSLDGKFQVNPIKVANPWDGETSWKVSGWIVGAWENYQGKSSPEPYWESQNFILTRNLLVIEYFHKGSNVTLKDIAASINEAGAGCFRNTPDGKVITELGKKVLTSFAATNPKAYQKNYSELKFDDVDRSDITQEIRVRTSERLSLIIGRYAKEREDFHMENNDTIQNLLIGLKSQDQKHATQSAQKLRTKLKELVNKDLVKKFPDPQPTEHDFIHTMILDESTQLINKFKSKYQNSGKMDQYLSIVIEACKWLRTSWSNNPPENRGSITSNMQPFLQQFQTPELAFIFSPNEQEESLNFDEIITEGKILVPDFPGIKIGSGLSKGIITLIKSRWQHSVLALGEESERLKIQIMDEAQRIMSFGEGEKAIGDFDYCELSRSFGGISWFLSQSVAALKAKAVRPEIWEKVHGVVRSVICMSTNDTSTIKFMQDIAGKEVKKRMSQTVTETANSPGLDLISEKYSGESDSLGVSYTISETLEERLQTSDIQDADAYSAVGAIYDGFKNNLCKIALRPSFWPDRHDSYELIQKSEFSPDNRMKIKRKISQDPIKEFYAQIKGGSNGSNEHECQ